MVIAYTSIATLFDQVVYLVGGTHNIVGTLQLLCNLFTANTFIIIIQRITKGVVQW